MPRSRRSGLLLLSVLLTLLVSTVALAAPTAFSRLSALATGESKRAAPQARTDSTTPSATKVAATGSSGSTTAETTSQAEASTTANRSAAATVAKADAPAGPVPANLLPKPAALQSNQQWALPSLTSNDWMLLPSPQAKQPLVVGYYAEDWEGDRRALNALRTAGNRIDRVVNFQLQLNADGTLTTLRYPSLMAEAKSRGIPVYGLLHNFQESQFSPWVARSVLSDPATRTKVVEGLLRVAQDQGLAGIDVDLENVPGDLRAGYTAFVRELASRVRPLGLGLTLSVPAKNFDDQTSNWGGAYDYRALGELADQVAIMTYDEHSFGLPAGPVASIGWVEGVIRYATSQIPPKKILMGIAAYGYDWVVGTTQVRGISVAGAMELAARQGVAIQWDDAAQVPYFTYTENGTRRIVYFENSYSAAAKLDLANRYGLGGIAVWRLGLEEARLWDVVGAKLQY